MTVRLRPMTLEDLPAVMVLEEELFAPDTWTEAMYRDELSRGEVNRVPDCACLTLTID